MTTSETPEKSDAPRGFGEIIGHSRAIDILQSMLLSDEIPHAILFMGEEGIGKRTVARAFAQTLLCHERQMPEGPEGEEGPIEPCGRCLSCQKLSAGNHPDFMTIEPEGSAIKIEQVRTLQDRIIYKPIDGPRRIILIDPADKMNGAAANGLLKTLEEPPAHAVLILITAKPYSLPETILSRCQKISFYPLSLSQVEKLLAERNHWSVQEARLIAALTGGHLGEALSLSLEAAREMEEGLYTLVSEKTLMNYERLFEVATTYSRDEEVMAKSLHYLAAWFRDVLVLQAVPNPSMLDPSWLVYSWRHEEIKRWAGRMNTNEVATFLSNLQILQQAQIRNVNRQLSLENLLMQLKDKLINQEQKTSG
ncbi:MAG: DNA polymerase III subunit delta' [Nitrospirae bacterium]|nr:DNA polymerase III subunit delta' [Candidatus Manganitrophaceae bacterium]